MNLCGHTSTTLRHHWACARYAGHPAGEHRYQKAPATSDHWLIFNDDREIVGCHCGFQADLDSDCGYGDSVVDHLLEQGTGT